MNLDEYPLPTLSNLGLTTLAAQQRLRTDGPNVLAAVSTKNKFFKYLGPLMDPMVILLIIATPIYAAIGEMSDAITTLIAIFPIIAIGWFLESRAQRSLEKLRELSAPTVVVWRDGKNQRIRTEDLVTDDVFWIQEGDVIPADGRIVELTQLSVNEAALTGESLPIAKAIFEKDSELGFVLAGTTVIAGRALVQTTATGRGTKFGAIGTLLAQSKTPKTPLQRAMSRLVIRIAAVAVLASFIVIIVEIIRGHGIASGLIAGISLLIAAIPEEFTVVYALYLSIGAWRLAQDQALVRNLPGAEALGSVTVICTDKTGTLTEGRLTVSGTTSITDDSELLLHALLASEPDAFDSLDIAIFEFAGQTVHQLIDYTMVTDWPFTSDGNYVTHVWKRNDGQHVVGSKGSYEGLIARSSNSDDELEKLRSAHDQYAKQGMRVIAVAKGLISTPTSERSRDESSLSLVGLIAFQDPVRQEVPAAIASAHAAGIRTIMITGDHPETARAIAKSMGQTPFSEVDLQVTTGAELATADHEERQLILRKTDVFARTSPEQKFQLVNELRNSGEVVAMTGDGINDAPALKAADIGIAMGVRGTTVAREAATIILLDDNFATIVTATKNGRRIYDNLTKAFGFLIAVHIPIIVAAVLVPILDQPLLLQPIHLVLLEVVLHPIVSLVFQAAPAADDIMQRSPKPSQYALSLRALSKPIFTGVVISIAVVSIYLWALNHQFPVGEARTFAFMTLLFAQPFLMLSMHSPNNPFWKARIRMTKQLIGAIVGVLLLIAGIEWISPITEFFKLASMSMTNLGIAALIAGAAIVITDVTKIQRTN